MRTSLPRRTSAASRWSSRGAAISGIEGELPPKGGSHAGGSHAAGSHAGGSHAAGSHAGGSHAAGIRAGGSPPSETVWLPASAGRLLLALLLAAAAVYFVALGNSGIWDANEAFYVETPREMLEAH